MTRLYLLTDALMSSSAAITEIISLLPETDIVMQLEEIAIQQLQILTDIDDGIPLRSQDLSEFTQQCLELIDLVEELKLSN